MKKSKNMKETKSMKKSKKQIDLLIIILIIIVLVILLFFINSIMTGNAIKQETVHFYFYDEITNCTLNGYLFIGDKLIGKSMNGNFNLTLEDYRGFENNSNENLSLFGKLGDCFKENKDMLFDKSWEMPKITDDLFYGESAFNFKTNIDIHAPRNREPMGFIQPDKIKPYLESIELKNNILTDPSSINSYLSTKIQYLNNSKAAYWQLPEETLLTNKGVCNDYSTTLLSLFLAYNPSLKCYNIILKDHVTTFCSIDKTYIYYDQQDKEVKKEITNIYNSSEIKSELTALNKEYLDYYGLEKTEIAKIAFNDKEYIEFNTNQDFIDWQYSLFNKDTKTNILSELETKNNNNNNNNNNNIQNNNENSQEINSTPELEYPIQSELGSQKPAPAELPTIKGFFQQNSLLIFPLFIILIILIIILIRVNRK